MGEVIQVKKSLPVQTAEFTDMQGNDYEPAFNWWVKHVLKKRDKTIASIWKQQTIYLKKSHKFGIELPKTMKQAYFQDANNGNNLWADEISKEMENVSMAFEVLLDGKSVPIGHQFMQYHMLFDIKMEDFRQKARLVAGGHIAKALAMLCMPV